MTQNLEWVSARSMAAHVPFGLKALCFHRRPPAGQTVRLYAVGDIGLFGRAGTTAEREGYAKLFQEVGPLLHTGDIVFGNLETPLLDWSPEESCFAAGRGSVESLKAGGFTLLHLANNHIYDLGTRGLTSTIVALEDTGIVPLGVGENRWQARQIVRTDRKGLRIGWFGCGRTLQLQAENGPHFYEFDHDELLEGVRQVRSEVDVLIVSIHIGLMYLDFPHPDHRALAERILAEGADLILMHHAHVLQGVEVADKGGVICHNLGNFLLDWEEGNISSTVMISEQKEGAVFLFDIDEEGICLAAALPTFIGDGCCVHWASGERGTAVLERLIRVSHALKGDYEPRFWHQRSQRNTGLIIEELWFHLCRGHWIVLLGMLRRIRIEHLRMSLGWVTIRVRALIMKTSRFGHPQR